MLLGHLVPDDARQHAARGAALAPRASRGRRTPRAGLVPEVLAAEIERDPVEPGGKLRAALEAVGLLERRRQRGLHEVLRLAADHHGHEAREPFPVRRHVRLEFVARHIVSAAPRIPAGPGSRPARCLPQISPGVTPNLSASSRWASAAAIVPRCSLRHPAVRLAVAAAAAPGTRAGASRPRSSRRRGAPGASPQRSACSTWTSAGVPRPPAPAPSTAGCPAAAPCGPPPGRSSPPRDQPRRLHRRVRAAEMGLQVPRRGQQPGAELPRPHAPRCATTGRRKRTPRASSTSASRATWA